MSKERVYTALALIFAFLQPMVPSFFKTPEYADIATTVIVTLVGVLTIKKQRVSIEVNNSAVILTWVLIAIALLGGAIDILGKAEIDETLRNNLRNAIVGIIGILNITSKGLFPTEAGKVIEGAKQDLKEQIKTSSETTAN